MNSSKWWLSAKRKSLHVVCAFLPSADAIPKCGEGRARRMGPRKPLVQTSVMPSLTDVRSATTA